MKKSEVFKIVFNGIITISAIFIGGFITFNTQNSILKRQKEYDFKINIITEKSKLYKETIDVFQLIINDLKPSLKNGMNSEITKPITNKLSNVFNRNILYFNDSLTVMFEQILKSHMNNYAINESQIRNTLKAMKIEIKENRKELNL